jgi:outer membrane lipoprotein-sorting protein
VTDIHFVLDPKSFMVRETVVQDAIGNRNHLRFAKVELNPAIDGRLFTFEVPPGVEVIKPPVAASPSEGTP